jgi:hypothetical protein
MEQKYDKLGRRIPQFDRKAAAKKAQKTREERHGPDFNKRIGSMGASLGTRGYFGKLKDTDPEKLKQISQAASEKSASRTVEERSEAVRKGWETRRESKQLQTPLRGATPQIPKAKGKK